MVDLIAIGVYPRPQGLVVHAERLLLQGLPNGTAHLLQESAPTGGSIDS